MANVLILEDDEEQAQVLRGHLIMHGHKALIAYSATEAVSHLNGFAADIALVDLIIRHGDQMVADGGLRFLHMIRSSHAHQTLPVIVTTGVSTLLAQDMGLWLKTYAVTQILQKPFNMAKLAQNIESLIQAEGPPATV
ncbi:MAG: response regulator [Pseudomonadota bacterium]